MKIIKNIKRHLGIGLLAGAISISAACEPEEFDYSKYHPDYASSQDSIQEVNEDIEDKCNKYFFRDNDGDGFGNVFVHVCEPIPGYVENNLDCDDQNMDLHPNAIEKCNTIDDNCNGDIDENVTRTCYSNCGDEGTEVCLNGEWQECNAPGLVELCNGIDDDCDGKTDENEEGSVCEEYTCNEALKKYLQCQDQDCKTHYLFSVTENNKTNLEPVVDCFEENTCEYPTKPCNLIDNIQGNSCMKNNCFEEFYWCMAGNKDGIHDAMYLSFMCIADKYKNEECIECYDNSTQEAKELLLEFYKCIKDDPQEECINALFQ